MLGLWLTSYTLTVNSTTLKIKAEETVETQGDAKSDSSVRSSRREKKERATVQLLIVRRILENTGTFLTIQIRQKNVLRILIHCIIFLKY